MSSTVMSSSWLFLRIATKIGASDENDRLFIWMRTCKLYKRKLSTPLQYWAILLQERAAKTCYAIIHVMLKLHWFDLSTTICPQIHKKSTENRTSGVNIPWCKSHADHQTRYSSEHRSRRWLYPPPDRETRPQDSCGFRQSRTSRGMTSTTRAHLYNDISLCGRPSPN